MEEISLLKTLVNAGIGSRRKVAGAIREGLVQVNGVTVTAFNHLLDINKDLVIFDGAEVRLKPVDSVYLILNKPDGVLSTTKDERGRATIMDFVPPQYKKLPLYPVGRLDKASTGLVLLTNDGEVCYRVTHPRFEHEKEYLVRLDQVLEVSDIDRLRKGVQLDDGITRPALVSRVENGAPDEYRIVIHEGKKHIVRRMFARLGYMVLELKRTRIAGIELGRLGLGETRLLSQKEIQYLQTL
jgi:23S rRNA pseudouridine2605 synthase